MWYKIKNKIAYEYDYLSIVHPGKLALIELTLFIATAGLAGYMLGKVL